MTKSTGVGRGNYVGNGKLTNEQRDEIFQRMNRSRSQRRESLAISLAEEFKISVQAVYAIFRDDKAIDRERKRVEKLKLKVELKLAEMADEAADVQNEFMHREDLPDNMLYIRQNAAVDILNRVGLKAKEQSEQAVTISFDDASLGVEIGMPEDNEEATDTE